MAQRVKKAPKRKRVDAAYAPDKRTAICPICFSRPDVGRAHQRKVAGKRGYGLTLQSAKVPIDGKSYTVASLLYPCSNPACYTEIVVEWAFLIKDLQKAKEPWVKRFTLTGANAKRYSVGRHTASGIWMQGGQIGEPEPEPAVEVTKPVKRVAIKAAAPTSKATGEGNGKKQRSSPDNRKSTVAKRKSPGKQNRASKRKGT